MCGVSRPSAWALRASGSSEDDSRPERVMGPEWSGGSKPKRQEGAVKRSGGCPRPPRPPPGSPGKAASGTGHRGAGPGTRGVGHRRIGAAALATARGGDDQSRLGHRDIRVTKRFTYAVAPTLLRHDQSSVGGVAHASSRTATLRTAFRDDGRWFAASRAIGRSEAVQPQTTDRPRPINRTPSSIV